MNKLKELTISVEINTSVQETGLFSKEIKPLLNKGLFENSILSKHETRDGLVSIKLKLGKRIYDEMDRFQC